MVDTMKTTLFRIMVYMRGLILPITNSDSNQQDLMRSIMIFCDQIRMGSLKECNQIVLTIAGWNLNLTKPFLLKAMRVDVCCVVYPCDKP